MLAAISGIALLTIAGVSTAAPGDETPRWQIEAMPSANTHDFSFENAGETFFARLSSPEDGARLLVVATHGAGVPDHDAPLYRHLHEALPGLGIAVLTYDRRGADGSAPVTETSDYALLASDAAAALRAGAQALDLPFERTGFWGLSQGGWIAAEAAGLIEGAGFVIMVSSPTTTPSEQMRFARENRLALAGLPEADIEAVNRAHREVESYLRGEIRREQAQQALDSVNAEPWFDLAMISPQAAPSREESGWRLEMDFNTVTAIRDADTPVLAILGGADPWIDAARSQSELQALREEGLDIDIVIIDGANHVMAHQEETMGLDTEAVPKDAPESAAYFVTLGHWLTERFPLAD
jgi:dienelactone hydrolase